MGFQRRTSFRAIVRWYLVGFPPDVHERSEVKILVTERPGNRLRPLPPRCRYLGRPRVFQPRRPRDGWTDVPELAGRVDVMARLVPQISRWWRIRSRPRWHRNRTGPS